MNLRRARIAVAVAIAASMSVTSAAAASANAADNPAAITGRVVTNSGGPVEGATVQAKSTSGTIYTTTSYYDGQFAITGLKPGKYSLKFSDRVGLFRCPESTCSHEFNDRYLTEWLGDSPTFTMADKIDLSAGEKHTGVREVFDHYTRITGKVTIDGRPAKVADHITIETYRDGKKLGAQLASDRWLDELTAVGNYRFRVSSGSNVFAPYWIVDPRDGNTTFHSDLIEKITGVRIDVVSAP